MAVPHVPRGFHTATPYLIVNDAASAIAFYKKAFNATELLRLDGPEGKIMHAEIRIGDSPIMLADEFPDMGYRSPRSIGGSPVAICLYFEEVDRQFKQAVEAGGTVKKPVQDQFYGDRSGTIEDPYGHVWTLATHIEDVEPDEILRRYETAMKEQGQT